MSKPRQEFITKWQKERAFFSKALIFDLKSNKESSWPYQPSTQEIAYENWVKDVVDPATNEYYIGKKRRITVSEDGKETETFEDAEPEQQVMQITRIRTGEGTEFLLTKGNLIGYNEFGREKRRYYSNIEMYVETTFLYETDMDSRSRKLRNNCKGPNGRINHYTMPFTDKNVDKLWALRDKRRRCLLVVKDEMSGIAKACNDLEMFKRQSVDYIMNDDYLGEKEKQQRREDFEALQTGLIEASTARKR